MALVSFGDGYICEDSDEDENVDSSDDDDDFLRMLDKGDVNKMVEKLEADDFEREMNQELSNTMDKLQSQTNVGVPTKSARKALPSASQTTEKYYDDVYFDSDSDGDESGSGKGKRKRSHRVLTNEELFYDPNMDKEDQEWVDRRWRNCFPESSSQTKTPRRLPSSDAVLNCPACMTTLCRDCQRHDIYKGQYRAMFVSNCKVNMAETLRYKPSKKGKRFKQRPPPSDTGTSSTEVDEIYHPVHCEMCNTHVAVYDQEEVYHFFNVLTGFG